MMGDDWENGANRNSVVQKVDEYLQRVPDVTTSAQEFENTIFRNSRSKDDYTRQLRALVFNLNKRAAQNANQGKLQATVVAPTQDSSQAGIGPEKSSLIIETQQADVQQPLTINNAVVGSVRKQKDATSWQNNNNNGSDNNNNMGDTGLVNTIQTHNVPVGNLQQLSQIGGKVIPVQMNIGNLAPGQMIVNIGNQIQRPQSVPLQQQQQNIHPSGFPFVGVNKSGFRQGTSTQADHSPLSLPSGQVPVGGMQQPSSFINSSPSTVVVSPASNLDGKSMGISCVPSPHSAMAMNSPQNQLPSPANNRFSEEERRMEKIRQLQKYAEPLKNLDCDKHSKLKKLIDTVVNPNAHSSVTLAILEKCEMVLRKQFGYSREDPQKVFFDAVNNALKVPNGSQVLYSTLMPAVKTLSGSDHIRLPPKRSRRADSRPYHKDSTNISYVIQSEVARLSSRFKVNLDSQQPTGSDAVRLVCQIDDANLPCVLPITLIVPSNYPRQPPQFILPVVDYSKTSFYTRVHEIMLARQKYLPSMYSITMLLDSWEVSIRQACSLDAVDIGTLVPFVMSTLL